MKTPVFLLLLLVPLLAAAGDAVPTDTDPIAAARAVELARKLRCLVCQNQSIAESNADLAVDLRREINAQIAAGNSDAEIIDFMVQRYGDFVLYRPPFKTVTVLLWLGPLLLLLVGGWMLRRMVRAQAGMIAPTPLSAQDHALAERLLGSEPGKDAS